MVYPRRLDVVTCGVRRTLLSIPSKCDSLNLLTLNSQSIPLLPPNLARTSFYVVVVPLPNKVRRREKIFIEKMPDLLPL